MLTYPNSHGHWPPPCPSRSFFTKEPNDLGQCVLLTLLLKVNQQLFNFRDSGDIIQDLTILALSMKKIFIVALFLFTSCSNEFRRPFVKFYKAVIVKGKKL